MVMDKLGMVILEANDKFYDWAKENELIDPFEIEAKAFAKSFIKATTKINGKEIPCRKLLPVDTINFPSEAEKRIYRYVRDMFMIDWIFAEKGYKVALEVAELWKDPVITEYLLTHKPCESVQRQCTMMCKYFGEKCEFMNKGSIS